MAKYFYRFDASSELGKKFRNFLYECDKANRAADTYCAKVGAKTFYGNESAFAGGVLCVGFEDGEKVDKRLWRSVGKDGDGYEMWEPNCQKRQDVIVLPRRDFRPSDTASRVYNKRPSRWQDVANLHTKDEWIRIATITTSGDQDKDWKKAVNKLSKETFCRYVELYISDEQRQEQATNPHYRMPLWMKRAIHLELQRLKLPIVSIQALYGILQTDLTDGKKDSTMKIVQPTTPIFFELYGRYYVGIDHPCNNPTLEIITPEKFNIRRHDFEKLMRVSEEKEN